jgi:hypothetical protein
VPRAIKKSGPRFGAVKGPLVPQPELRKLLPKPDLKPIELPGRIELPPQNGPARPQNGGAQRPRIPRPDPLQLDPNIDLGPVRIPDDIVLPGGQGNNPPAENPPAENPPAENPPGDNPPADNPPGENPPEDNPPEDNPPIVPIPFPIFWPLFAGGGHCPAPCYEVPTIGGEAIPATAAADLVLEDVQYVEPATLLVGPAYRVKFRNQGAEAVGTFRVALFAGMDGRVSEDAPRATVEVPGLAGGESRELTLRLPRTAMTLTSAATGRPAAFTHLFVAVDLDNGVNESDETNNVAIVERTLLEEAAR